MIKGILVGILCYVLWGFLPVYWKMIEALPSVSILAFRIFLSSLLCGALMLCMKNTKEILDVFKNKRSLAYCVMGGMVVTLNWGLYIWAVNSGKILETSLGYYINPLLAMAAAAVIFKEKLTTLDKVSIGLATLGVSYTILQYGEVPWVSLIIAATFVIYSICKKKSELKSLTSITIETLVVAPFALVYILFAEFSGNGVAVHLNSAEIVILMLAGVVTVLPLYLFGYAVNHIPFATVGFIQYLSPTITFLLGVFVYGEQLTQANIVTFSFIWSAIVLFMISRSGLIKKGVK